MFSKVSIIVPIFNSAKSLERCVESILGQTYRNIEIILVDDGSTDRSRSICDEFAKRDSRIIVLHQDNSGVSSARNCGISLANGDYIQFVDSDDYLDNNMTEILVGAAKSEPMCLVICGYKMIDSYTGSRIKDVNCNIEGYYSKAEFLDYFDLFYQNFMVNPPWNKLFNAQIVKEKSTLFAKELELGEDLLFNLEIINNSHSFQILAECPYNYVIDDTGNSLTSKYRKNIYEIHKYLFENISLLFEEYTDYDEQIKKLEIIHTENILSNTILLTAVSHSIRDYSKYYRKMKQINTDPALIKSLPQLRARSKQIKLMKFLMKNNMFGSIYLYARIKKHLRNQMPRLFRIMSRFGGA